MGVKLVHGLKNGKIVRVTDVANGLACDCVCLDCKTRLIAVNNAGISVSPHFKHYRSKEKESIACKASLETAIHYLAKDIVERKGSITLPAYYVTVNKHNGRGSRRHLIKEQKYVSFDSVINENSVSTNQGFQDIKPDLIAYSKERRLFVEIAVSHPADNKKIESLKKHNVSAIEIDLSNFDRTGSKEDLEKYLYKKAPIKWLHHVEHEKFYKKASGIEDEKAKWAAHFAKKEVEERKVRESAQKEIYIEKLQARFCNEFECIILGWSYKGDLFNRIEQFIQSEYRRSINFYRRKGFLHIEHEIEGLGDISFCYETDDAYEVECEFMGLSLKFSVNPIKYTDENLSYYVIAGIYYQASMALCSTLERKVFNQEIERARARELEEKRREEFRIRREQEEKTRVQQKLLEKEIEEERRCNKIEEQKKEIEKRKTEEEKLVLGGIAEMLENKRKLAPWKKEHPIMPGELIKFLKMKLPIVNNKNFVDIRQRLQNKGMIKKVEQNKLLTAVIVK